MSSSEIRIKRRDVMSAREVADHLRQWANQLDAENTVTLDGIPIPVASVVFVRQDYKKAGNEHSLTLKLNWTGYDESDPSLAEEPDDVEDDDLQILPRPGEPDMPPGPLDLPGPVDAQPKRST
ncbi:amphi-Trp domain-containing protein [Tumebacillus flagellatus]|uniref:Amphi-Trp domain-containing protein n=1 Tax=Tumebacillus flagellatus TaxID=1157490 RepID=A0A074MCI8_9BACL|nr:amphi-Trp domain-containing protein [Tumebacillus flagellatus]KEO83582.1 hypothetical protein EL26_09220 [Tumebacillus flagellatus]